MQRHSEQADNAVPLRANLQCSAIGLAIIKQRLSLGSDLTSDLQPDNVSSEKTSLTRVKIHM